MQAGERAVSSWQAQHAPILNKIGLAGQGCVLIVQLSSGMEAQRAQHTSASMPQGSSRVSRVMAVPFTLVSSASICSWREEEAVNRSFCAQLGQASSHIGSSAERTEQCTSPHPASPTNTGLQRLHQVKHTHCCALGIRQEHAGMLQQHPQQRLAHLQE